jgi:3-hydroxyacyl-[acyl-carrier-protein] dehydratase
VRGVTTHPSERLTAGTPHRHPMQLVDRLDTLVARRHGTAWKAVSGGETHAGGEAAEDGLSPALLVDALGQLAIVVLSAEAEQAHSVFYLGAIDAMEFGAPAQAGDLVRLEASVERTFRGSSRVSVNARVGQRQIARGSMVLASGAGRRAANAPERAREPSA